MKVYIGPYINWFGPYQLADLLQKIGVSEEKCRKIGEWLSKTWLNTFLNWLYNKRKRKVKIKIHKYDIWNLDNTLSLIILPVLLKLKEDKLGIPYVDNNDVPENLKSDSEEFEVLTKKWEYVLNEMIFAFQSKQEDWESKFRSGEIDIIWTNIGNGLNRMDSGPNDTYKLDIEGKIKYQERISNGFRLFGKYYETLWT